MKTRANIRAICMRGDKVLLLLARKGYWQNVQGGIDEGENEQFALAREVLEETNLEVLEIIENTRTQIEYDATRGGEPIHVVLTAYACRVDGEVVIGKSEDAHQDFKWVDIEEAKKMLIKYPEQLTIFNEVLSKLNK